MKNKIKILTILAATLIFSTTATASTILFTNCGATGAYGPDSGYCAYDENIDIIGEGIQEWTVPATGEYRITAYGAQGAESGSNNPGLGGVIEGEFVLEEDDVLRILVGQMGEEPQGIHQGGGGGTFVVKEVSSGDTMFDGQDVSPLIVAGGGGGIQGIDAVDHSSRDHGLHEDGDTPQLAPMSTCGEDGWHETTNDPGLDGCNDDTSRSQPSDGFVTGGGSGHYYRTGSGGAGWGGDSVISSYRYNLVDAESFLSGGVGSYSSRSGNEGGFGGGGAGDRDRSGGDHGGGGGYTGGGAGYRFSYGLGGGGGSFIHADADNPATSDGNWDTTGTEPHDVYTGAVSDLGERSGGHGSVEIEYLDGDMGYEPQFGVNIDDKDRVNDQTVEVTSLDKWVLDGDVSYTVNEDGSEIESGTFDNSDLIYELFEIDGFDTSYTIDFELDGETDQHSFTSQSSELDSIDVDENIGRVGETVDLYARCIDDHPNADYVVEEDGTEIESGSMSYDGVDDNGYGEYSESFTINDASTNYDVYITCGGETQSGGFTSDAEGLETADLENHYPLRGQNVYIEAEAHTTDASDVVYSVEEDGSTIINEEPLDNIGTEDYLEVYHDSFELLSAESTYEVTVEELTSGETESFTVEAEEQETPDAPFDGEETLFLTNCGTEGRFGPDSEDCESVYDDDAQYVGVNAGIQTLEIGSSGYYRIRAYGAEGGPDSSGTPGGKGAVIDGVVELNENEILKTAIGQKGQQTSSDGGSGGGGTFIAKEDASGDELYSGTSVKPLVIAAGGGGCDDSCSYGHPSRLDGQLTNWGDDVGEGDSSCGGSTGASWSQYGDSDDFDKLNRLPSPFLSSPVGADEENTQGVGGFGGGGGLNRCNSGQGGGGYSGGWPEYQSSGTHQPVGGGSFIHADVQNPATSDGTWDTTGSEPHDVYSGSVDDLGEWNEGHGYVEIELLTDSNNPDIQAPFNPSKSQASSTSSPADMSFSVDVDIDDDGGAADDNTLDSCSVSATGQDNGGTTGIGTSITSSGSDGGTGTCEFSVENDDNSNWEPGETIEVEVSVEDSYDGSDTISREHEFENTAPEVVDISVVDGDLYSGEAWGGQNGITLEADIVDYESATTDTGVDVEIFGDLGQIGSTLTASNGDDIVSVNWERGGESDMLGFDRGESYSFSAEASDVDGAMSDDSGSLDVLSEASVSDPFPVEGDSGDVLEVVVDENPAVDVDGDLSGFDVEFWIEDSPGFELEGSDTVSGSSGTASIDVEDLELDNPPADWKFVIDDTYSETDYGESPYDGNTDPSAPYSFVTAEAPVILEGDSSSGPVDESGVELNPDLEILVDDPDNSDVEVTFYEGETGSDQIGDPVTVSDGSGVATLDSEDHSLGENAGDSFEWSVRAEDVEFGEVAESDTFSVDIVEEPDISFETPDAGDSSDVAINEDLTVEITQGDDETVGVDYTVENGDTFTDTGTVSDTESGSMFSSSFDLEPDTEYTWSVEASFTDDGGNEVSVVDDLTFDTAEAPGIIDFSPDDGESGLENPELEVEFDDNGNPVTVEFYDWENDEVLDTQTGVTSGEASFDTSGETGFGDEAGNSYFWYVVLEDEIKGTVQNSSMPGDDPWEFRTPEVLDADIDIERGDGHNMNPGSADVGPETLQISATNDEELNMESAEISIDGTVVDTVSPVPHGQTVSVDITEDVVEDEEYSWSVEIIEDGIIIAEESGLEFSTHVVDAQWVTGDPELTAGFNVYHSNSDDVFDFGEGSYEQVGSTSDEELKLAIEDLGYNGDDCFRVTAHNSAGESSDASPSLGDSAECVGGEID